MNPSASRRRKEWDDLAAVDPSWGVLTLPQHKHASSGPPGAFWASGAASIDAIMSKAEALGVPEGREVALDFGCGLGRLTRPLATPFRRVVGVDISPSLVEQAHRYNAEEANCEFRVLDDRGLAVFERDSFDIVCSLLVLQHQSSRRAADAYIREFVRILRPNGLAVFQLPTHIPVRHRIQPRRRLYGVLRAFRIPPATLYARLRLDPIRMIHVPRPVVIGEVEQAGGVLLATVADHLAAGYPSATYYVTKRL